MYRAWGGSVINMSALPEAKLAREAELAYQMICMATDYDCWRSGGGDGQEGDANSHGDVDVAMVMKHMEANGRNARHLVAAVLDELARHEYSDLVLAKHWEGSAAMGLKFMTKPQGRGEEAKKKTEYLFPGIWDE
jgi:5'-methylthioadenosine phosphorylase